MKRLAEKHPDEGVPAVLHGNPEAIAIFNNLPSILSPRLPAGARGVADVRPDYGGQLAELALEIDRTVRDWAPAGWKGDQAREAQVLNALFPLLNRDREATQAVFDIIKNQPGY